MSIDSSHAHRTSNSDSDADSHVSMLSTIRGRGNTDFDSSSCMVVCSGYLTKKARGRHPMGQMFGNTRLRWFELCVDGDGLEGTGQYCLFYYKDKGGKLKGAIQLSALDTIILSDSNPCLLSLQLEKDKETSGGMLHLLAEDEDCCERWVEVLQAAILTLNRLTMIVEGDDEDRVTSGIIKGTSSMGLDEVIGRASTFPVEGSKGAGTPGDAVMWSKNNKGFKRQSSHDRDMTVVGSQRAANIDSAMQVRKRDIVKGWLTGHNEAGSGGDGGGEGMIGGGGMGGEDDVGIFEWGKISGNKGNASWAKAIMWCAQKEMEMGSSDDEEEGGGEEEEGEGEKAARRGVDAVSF
ncbi:hypothetical protein TrRE_jg4370 [Triparma retinervis]|uniref:PH domain-containing protein n=1 Tax=Triparma retinervis TaxID=2557542 RepID=A0A9W6ZRF2_9STRA|nr:hypothetical protein TrRE_jg4370 [Triparma retinervis]